MIGKDLLHYKIIAKLGSGGMGDVYRAHDTGKLDRDVALKVLPERLAGDPERLKRFEREAAVVAALNHPNIVTIHSIEEADGVHFITMELVEGQTLSQLIPPGGMTLDRFFDVAVPLADAISVAHAKGVAHRDLKPANIMVDEAGRVKVLDFGLAKLVESDINSDATIGADSNTAEGVVMGTVSYMSPEQAEGAAIDHRTDVFSLGIIMYEMITGERPFKGNSNISTLSSILKDNPPPVTEVKQALPTHLGRIINRCLAKNADDRVQSVLDLRNDLRGLREEVSTGAAGKTGWGGEVSAPEHSVATAAPSGSSASVTGGPPQSDSTIQSSEHSAPHTATAPKKGIGPGKLAAIILVPLAVVLFTLRMFTGSGEDGTAPGASGGATTTTSGAKADNAADNAAGNVATSEGPTKMVVLPFENLGAPDDEYFADGITDEITSRLAVIPGIAVISRTTARKYKNTDKEMRVIGAELGVDYVLEGTIRWDKRGEVERVRITPQLIKVADDFHVWAENYERDIDEIFTVQADIATRIAEALNVTLLESDKAVIASRPTESMEAYQFYLRGIALITEGDQARSEINGAVTLLERAIELDPRFTDAYAWISRAHSAMVHFGYDRAETRRALAKEAADRALELDPGLVNAHVALGFYYYWGRKDYEPALAAAARALEIQPKFVPALELKAWSLRRMGRMQEAVDIMLRIVEYNPGSAVTLRDIADTYTYLRRYSDAARYDELSIVADPGQLTAYSQLAAISRLQGDLAGARARLDAMPAFKPSEFPRNGWLPQYLAERSGDDLLTFARAVIGGLSVDQSAIVTTGEIRGLAYTLLGQPERAREAYASAIAPLDSIISARPDDFRAHMAIARVYAGMGRRDDAIRAGEKGFSLYNPSIDAMSGQFVAEDLAIVYAMSGEHDKAFEAIEKLLSSPAEFSIESVKQDPGYDGLREDKRYQELLEKYGG